MEVGMGILGWAPDQFWNSTSRELSAALDGWQEANGGPGPGLSPEERESLQDLMAQHDGPSPSIRNRNGHDA